MGNELMDDLAAAWPEEDDLTLSGAVEEETDDQAPDEPDQPEELPDEPAESTETEGSAIGGNEPGADGAVLGGEQAPADGEEPAEEDLGSPVSWNATAREFWKDIPKEAQEYITQRESQMQQGMQRNAEYAKRAEAMDRTLQPYQQYFAMNGNQPAQSIETLLQTASILQMGAPNQRAQMVATLISQFGVDIPALDAILTGKEPEQGTQPQQDHNIQQAVQKAIAPYQQHMQQLQQTQQHEQQQTQAEAGIEVQSFAQDAKNEFYNDVRGDMADILDMASNKGINMTMKEAYDRACMLNPQISKILMSRQQQQQMQKRRRAASSVQGTLGGQGDSAPMGTMRGAIEEAWDNAGRT